MRAIYDQRRGAEDDQICPHIDGGFPRASYSIIPPPHCRSQSLAAQGFEQPEMRTSNPASEGTFLNAESEKCYAFDLGFWSVEYETLTFVSDQFLALAPQGVQSP